MLKRWLLILAILACPLALLLGHILLASWMSEKLSDVPKTVAQPKPKPPPYRRPIPQDKGLTLTLVLDKSEVHNFEPVNITLRLANHGKEEVVMASSQVSSSTETRIDFGDACTPCIDQWEPLSHGVVVPPGKTVELRMPGRVFATVGEHQVVSILFGGAGIKPAKSNPVPLKVRQATDEEVRAWRQECLDLYEQAKAARRRNDSETFWALYGLLTNRIGQDRIFSISIWAKILEDDLLDDETSKGVIHSLGALIHHSQKEKELVEKTIDIQAVIRMALKALKTEDVKKVNSWDLVASDLRPWMSDADKLAFKESIKACLRNTHDGGGDAYMVALLFLGVFPEESEIVEKALQRPDFLGDDPYGHRKQLEERLEWVRQRTKEPQP